VPGLPAASPAFDSFSWSGAALTAFGRSSTLAEICPPALCCGAAALAGVDAATWPASRLR
jgi:hypothetical protein